MVTTDIAVDPTNQAAFEAWNGSEGECWAENDELYDVGLARYDPAFFAAAAITSTERVLDVGCGTGSTTCEAARCASQGSALGVDLSARMIQRARDRAAAAGLGNAQFLQADAQIHPFPASSFDQVISRTGVMFFGDPVTAFSNIAHPLRRFGRLTLLVWQSDDRNPWIGEFVEATVGRASQTNSADDSKERISFDRPEQVEALLARTGFVDVTFDPLAESISFGPDPETAFRFVRGIGFVKSLLNAVEADARRQALDALRASLAAHTVADGVLYPSAMWLIGGRRA